MGLPQQWRQDFDPQPLPPILRIHINKIIFRFCSTILSILIFSGVPKNKIKLGIVHNLSYYLQFMIKSMRFIHFYNLKDK